MIHQLAWMKCAALLLRVLVSISTKPFVLRNDSQMRLLTPQNVSQTLFREDLQAKAYLGRG